MTKTALVHNLQIWITYFAASFFKALAIYSSRKATERDARYFVRSLFLKTGSWRIPQFVNTSVPSWTSGHLDKWVIKRNPLFKILKISGRISSQIAAFLATSILTDSKNSATVVVFFSSKSVIGFKRSFKFSLHLRMMSLSLLSKTLFGFW